MRLILETRMNSELKCWYAAVDWASKKHDIVVTDREGKRLGQLQVEHSGEGLARMADWLIAATGGVPDEIHVAIEVPHGPIVDTLIERGFKVYSINPKQVDRFRDRFTVAGAKDDSRDCDVMASALRTDMHCFRLLATRDPMIIELKEWSHMHEEHGRDRRRYTSRLREQLLRYFPAFLQLEGEFDADWKLELLERAPTPKAAAALSRSRVSKILERNRVRAKEARDILAVLQQPAVITSPGTTEAAAAHATALLASIRLAKQLEKEAKAHIEDITDRLVDPISCGGELASDVCPPKPEQTATRSDAAILFSFPGIGRLNLATLLCEASESVGARDYEALRCQGGVAPVTKQSGKRRYVVQRRACSKRLANALLHWARVAIQHDPSSRAKYQALRARGKSWPRALRAVADRLLYLACAALRSGTLYNPELASKKSAC
jgi:transposase